MSVEDFIKIPDNPIQRDTKSHAKMAINKSGHLQETCPTHAMVAIAEIANGQQFKLDGHTRAFLFDRQLLEAPKQMLVSIYKVESIEDACELYRHFDNSKAVEATSHKIYGALKFHKIKVAHLPFLNASGLKTAMRFSFTCFENGLSSDKFRSVTEVEAIAEWKKECRILFGLSDINYQNRKNMIGAGWTGAMTLAALLTIRIHGNAALSFWEAVSNGDGEKSKGTFDAVELATQYVKNARADKRLNTSYVTRHTWVFLNLFDAWINNETYSNQSALKAWTNGEGTRVDHIREFMAEHGHKGLKTFKQQALDL